MVGPSAPLLGTSYTEIRDHLYAGMQSCHHCVNIREPGVDGGLLSRRISINNWLAYSQVHHRHCRVHAAKKVSKRAKSRKENYNRVSKLPSAT